MDVLLLLAVGISLFFAFWTGFTDAANVISTIVATRVLKPTQAVALAAVGNFFGVFIGTAIAVTIGKGILNGDNIITGKLVLAALVGGLAWDIITYYWALPVSETHVLIGGLLGAGYASGGLAVVNLKVIVSKVVIPMVTAPIIAAVVAFVFAGLVARFFWKRSKGRTNAIFGKLQIVSTFLSSITQGTNDAQKTMGIITAVLLSHGAIASFKVPIWVFLASYSLISFGTLLGGWRIVKTMGMRLTRLRPYHGFCAEMSGSIVLFGAAALGFPISSNHAIAGSIIGVGATRRLSAVRWGVTRKIVGAWVLTVPASALLAFGAFNVLSLFV